MVTGTADDSGRPGSSGHRVARRPQRRLFFIGIAVLMLIVVGLGFGRSFYLRPVFVGGPLPAYLILHGIVMTAWFVLFLVQAVLVSARRTDVHRKLGIAGVVLAAGVAITAVIINLNLAPRALNAGLISRPEEALDLALGSLSSLIPFVVLLVLAIANRHRPQVHKRLMFWVFAWMLGPAFAPTRPLGQVLDSLTAPLLPFFPSDLIWLLALAVYDWTTLRRIHPATYIPFVVLFGYVFVATPWITENAVLRDWLLTYWRARI